MTSAWAHTLGEEAPLSFAWSFDPLVVIPLLATGYFFLAGTARLRQRGRSSRRPATLAFWSGFLILTFALVSPIHEAGESIFTIHMIEHELLMVAAAPLLAAARPGGVLLWGLPPRLRQATASLMQTRAMRVLRAGSHEIWTATALHTFVLWIWHAPNLFRGVLDNTFMHVSQHLSFFVSALIFWSAVFTCERSQRQAAAIIALFLTSLQAGFLGALLTFSRVLWYPFAPDPFPICGLSRFEDQSLAGLTMWIPACSVYVVAGLILASRWLQQLETRHA